MPTFHQRPLTWLFFIATLSIDLAVLLLGHGERPFSFLVVGFLIGQMFWAGSWLVAGEAHRLARGAGFVLGVAGLTTVIVYADDRPGDWGQGFAAVAILAGAAAASTVLCVLVLGRLAALRDRQKQADFRFPLIELFGWTIVVALASVALRSAQFEHLMSRGAQLAHAIAISATGGLIYALFLSRNAKASIPRCVVAGTAIAAVIAAGASPRVGADRDLYYGFFWACTYLGGLILVDRLDRRMPVAPSTEYPQLGILTVDEDPVPED